jgi:hypothetical protein
MGAVEGMTREAGRMFARYGIIGAVAVGASAFIYEEIDHGFSYFEHEIPHLISQAGHGLADAGKSIASEASKIGNSIVPGAVNPPHVPISVKRDLTDYHFQTFTGLNAAKETGGMQIDAVHHKDIKGVSSAIEHFTSNPFSHQRAGVRRSEMIDIDMPAEAIVKRRAKILPGTNTTVLELFVRDDDFYSIRTTPKTLVFKTGHNKGKREDYETDGIGKRISNVSLDDADDGNIMDSLIDLTDQENQDKCAKLLTPGIASAIEYQVRTSFKNASKSADALTTSTSARQTFVKMASMPIKVVFENNAGQIVKPSQVSIESNIGTPEYPEHTFAHNISYAFNDITFTPNPGCHPDSGFTARMNELNQEYLDQAK